MSSAKDIILTPTSRVSRYQILLDWVAVQYPKPLDLSIDKKRALQRIRLKSPSGEWVPITFQFGRHSDPSGGGDLWLIDQVLVKTIDPMED